MVTVFSSFPAVHSLCIVGFFCTFKRPTSSWTVFRRLKAETLKKKLALLLAALCLLLALTGCGEKEQSVHVTLYNQSGHDITSVCITPASSDDWGENFLDETLADGNGVTIGLGTYKESEVPTEWNILVYGEENYILYETDVDEVDFTMHDGDCVGFQSLEEAISIVGRTDAE